MKTGKLIIVALFILFIAVPALSQPVTLVAVGDSLTAGDGDDGSGGGYPARLLTMLQSDHPGSTLSNRAISGDTTQDLINKQLADAVSDLNAAPAGNLKIAIVWIGSNDLFGLYAGDVCTEYYPDLQTCEQTEMGISYDNVNTILRDIKATGASIYIALLDDQTKRPVIADESIRNDFFPGITNDEVPRMSAQIASYNNQIKIHAGTATVDFFNTTIFENPSTLSDDGNHPNGAGYDAIAQIWYQAITGSGTTTVQSTTTTTMASTTTTVSPDSTTTTTAGVTTTTVSATTTVPATTSVPATWEGSLRLHPEDLVYKGAFAFPEGDEWGYGGHALAYYPAGDSGGSDGYPGSLYTSGNAQNGLVGEISIPEPVISDDFNSLPKAAVLRSLADITGGRKENCTYCEDCQYRNVDGLEYLPNIGKIVWNLRDWYNVSACDQDSLGWSNPDMSSPQGVWHIGSRGSSSGEEEFNEFHNSRTCDYLFKAPEDFADKYLGGKRLIAGNHRESGTYGGSQGPSLFATAPWKDGNPPSDGQNLDALALVYYRERFGCAWNEESEMIPKPGAGACDFPDYRAFDNWTGGAWVQSGSVSAILIFGTKSMGDNCYGTQEHCGDPCNMGKGYHAYPYETQVLFYDPEDLKAVISGTSEPWEVLPYKTYSLSNTVIGGECSGMGAAAYDEESGLLYVTEQEAGPDGESVVHVWKADPFSAADVNNDGKIGFKDVFQSLKNGNLRAVILALNILAGF
jgi:lysophospholipase L1-like esterase